MALKTPHPCVLVLAGLLLAGCGGAAPADTETAADPTPDPRDACAAFEDVQSEAEAGILTDDEYREGLREVYDLAEGDATLRGAAEAALAHATAHESAAHWSLWASVELTAAADVRAACRSLG